MADIRLKLLGDVNGFARSAPSTLAPKYVAVITAEALSALLKYRRQKGKHPIRLEPDSIIKVDGDVQRGLTDMGTLRQEDKKIDEIKQGILGESDTAPMMFLGSLIWNVREQGSGVFRKLRVSEEGQPAEYELSIKAPSIYLTDSAHRHFGIAEAYKAFSQNHSKYTKFKPDFEFTVEIYNLDRSGERLLFNELNSKQKKITAAKQQQMDTTSDIGLLKDRISSVDLEGSGLLNQNIEVNSNLNDRHTLMTMSVFTASIREMFGNQLISEAKADDELRDELAQYYCDFLYKLHETIRSKVTISQSEVEIAPFSNLYAEIISPAFNEAATLDDEAGEQVIQGARERANKRNADIRAEEKIHSNPFIKALFWIGGQIRQMKNWQQVIDQIQLKLNANYDGRYFQKKNDRWLKPNAKGIAIGVEKEDGTLNIQVQTHVISEIKRLLLAELDLQVNRQLYCVDSGTQQLSEIREDGSSKVYLLSKTSSNRFDFQLDFITGSEVSVDKSQLKLKVVPDIAGDSWKEAERRGAKSLVAHELLRVEGWVHPVYGDSLAKYTATFALETGPFPKDYAETFQIKLESTSYDLGGIAPISDNFALSCQAG